MKTKISAVGEVIGLPLLLLFDFMMPMEQASLQRVAWRLLFIPQSVSSSLTLQREDTRVSCG